MSDPINLAERRLEPCPDVVACLEEALELAKAGEIRSVAIASEAPGGCTASAHAMGDGDVAHLVCALDRVKLRLLTEVG